MLHFYNQFIGKYIFINKRFCLRYRTKKTKDSRSSVNDKYLFTSSLSYRNVLINGNILGKHHSCSPNSLCIYLRNEYLKTIELEIAYLGLKHAVLVTKTK